MLDLSHKKLIAWQKAMAFFPPLYQLCTKLPKEEMYNLSSQMKRAALSISNNLVEGASRKSKLEKNRFFEVARSSAVEIDNCLTACLALQYFKIEQISAINAALLEIFKLITGLIESNRD
ncbi:MAG: ribosomal protein [Flaviaesturariibacter sp.]|nr:ribosomal protein [Flaviaesturariibacter sp.]